mgnify:CR=1 FL=1
MKATTLLTVMVIAAGGAFAYDKYKSHWAPPEPPAVQTATRTSPAASSFDRPWGQRTGSTAAPAPVASASPYQCDGRTHCSQMRSCAEAQYFLQHCPNTKMDGDRDGIPCENQWCN